MSENFVKQAWISTSVCSYDIVVVRGLLVLPLGVNVNLVPNPHNEQTTTDKGNKDASRVK